MRKDLTTTGAKGMMFHWWKQIFFAITVLSAGTAQAQTRGSPSVDDQTIILLSPSEEKQRIQRLHSVIEAHISDFSANIAIKDIDALPIDMTSQINLARDVARKSGALSLIWIDWSTQDLYLFASEKDTYSILVHDLPHSEGGWEAECDAIAAMVRSALLPWFSQEKPPSYSLHKPAAKESISSQQPANSASSKKTPLLVVGLAYAPSLLDLRKTIAHGGEIDLGLRVWKFLELNTYVRITQSTRMKVEDENISLVRLPLGISATAVWPLKALDLGLRIGLVVDITSVYGIDKSAAPSETDIVHPGLATSVLVRYRVLDWLAIFADIGFDFYFDSHNYKWDDAHVLTYKATQPRLGLGLSLILPIR